MAAKSFCLLCWLFGHKWKLVTRDNGWTRHGIFTRHCCRCGEPNPLYGRPAAQVPAPATTVAIEPPEEECDE